MNMQSLFFTLFGARQVSSVDYSDYEGATHIHDFNKPLPTALKERFSVVFDGGTIEHVFNIPEAFKNCMEMVRIGGHFIQVSPANNFMGHGFWQISPELIYRIFSQENGFELKAVLMHESSVTIPKWSEFGTWYKVDDPSTCHSRVELVNSRPTYICTIAQRVEERRIFEYSPQQSDYVEAWNQVQRQDYEGSATLMSSLTAIRRKMPHPLKRLFRSSRDAMRALSRPFRRPYYHRISDDDVVHGRI
jgi:hypothetical protein